MPAHVRAKVLSTHTPAFFSEAVAEAAEFLRAGKVVGLPTETVYGLAANALNPAAVQRIFAVKGRPAHNPIIVHVADLPMARRCVSTWPTTADKLAAVFWPGPLTLVLPRSSGVPDIVTAGGPTVGVRWPSHPFMQAVIRACDFPLAAPSANRSGELSPTTAEHVRRNLGKLIPLIVDGGPAHVGIESTVLDLSVKPPRVLRPGTIHAESLAAVLGERVVNDADISGEPLRSPGLLSRHYSPNARMLVLSWTNDEDLRTQLARHRQRASKIHVIAHSHVPLGDVQAETSVIPHDPEAFARALYAELHRCDELGADLIVVEAPPASPEWEGIADRLRRASARL